MFISVMEGRVMRKRWTRLAHGPQDWRKSTMANCEQAVSTRRL